MLMSPATDDVEAAFQECIVAAVAKRMESLETFATEPLELRNMALPGNVKFGRGHVVFDVQVSSAAI